MSDDHWEGYEDLTTTAGPRRQLTLLAVAAVVAIAAGGAGFAAGWASHGSKRASTSLSFGDTASTGTSIASGRYAPATTIVGSSGGSISFGSATAGLGAAVVGPSYLPPTATQLGRRVTSDGVSVRAFEASFAGAATAPLPAQCFPSRLVTVELSDTAAVGIGSAPLYSSTGSVVTVVADNIWGVSEGAPAAWAVIATDASVTNVSVSFAGGITDHTAPVHGIAVVASILSSVPSDGITGTVTATSAAKTTTIPLTASPGATAAPACPAGPGPVPATTVPAAPSPGPQPADPAAAKAAVVKAFHEFYTAGSPTDLTYVQGADQAVIDAAHQVRADNPTVTDVSDTVQQVVFTSPATAWVQFQILVNGNPVTTVTGAAVLDQNVWKLTRATACADYALGGAHC